LYSCADCFKKRFKSIFEKLPMGFKSALLQSYFVKYPRRPSSRFADPNTNKNPF